MDVLYAAYESGVEIKNVATLESTPWLEEDNRPYVEGVSLDFITLDDFLRGKEAVSVYAYIRYDAADGKRISDDEFLQSLPNTGMVAVFLERSANWIIHDIEVLKFQWKK